MTDEDNYIEYFISTQGIYDNIGEKSSEEQYRPPKQKYRGWSDEEVDVARGLISAKTVFYVIGLTALFTAIINPALLIYTLPIVTFVSSILSLDSRRKRREPRRIRYGG